MPIGGTAVTIYGAIWRFGGWLLALGLIFGQLNIRGLDLTLSEARVAGFILLGVWVLSTLNAMKNL